MDSLTNLSVNLSINQQAIIPLINVHNRLVNDPTIEFYGGELYDVIYNLLSKYGYTLLPANFFKDFQKVFGIFSSYNLEEYLSFFVPFTIEKFKEKFRLINKSKKLIETAMVDSIDRKFPAIYTMNGTTESIINLELALKNLLYYNVIETV